MKAMQSNKEMIDFLEEHQEHERIPKEVFDAMRVVDRKEFLPESIKHAAYEPRNALPIGYGQTCSAPNVVSTMSKLLELERGHKILEIGSGCGWHASVTGEIVNPGKVITLEIIPQLAKMARENISRAKEIFGRDWNIEVVNVDGSIGYDKEKPYDRVYFTAGTPGSYPVNVLSNQLVEGGKCLLAPNLGFFRLGVKKGERVVSRNVTMGYFGFVPLRGEHGYK